ncbi:expressed unknown protein [Seminavis robusta]|uniref:TFIIH p62 subunit N-terminal domain-containing protein n=1 Tax=Seminavis robusta TaxID=568900 RepID=A0A9N8DUC4_9STRA|nr:expressed unknown protein [Seminavis robusta]|eukprot:Sro286_g108370.1 n/a (1019) ;mRNA; f:56010-59066
MSSSEDLSFDKVKFGKSEGTLMLSASDLSFKADGKTLKVPLANIAKHQINPKSHAKALLKVMMKNNKPAKLFQMETRSDLEKINNEIINRLREFPADDSRDKPPVPKAAAGAAAASSTDDKGGVYQGVHFRNMVGSLHLLEKQLKWESSEEGGKTFALAYANIAKQQKSPPKIAKCILKLTKPDDKVFSFQVASRDDLESLNKEVEKRRKQQQPAAPAKKAPATKKAAAERTETADGVVYSQVIFKAVTGNLTLSKETLAFESTGPKKASKAIRWSRVTKSQGNPPSHAKVLLKVFLTDDSPLLFQLQERPLLQQLKNDIEARMKTPKAAKKNDNKQKLGDQLSALQSDDAKKPADDDAVTVETKFQPDVMSAATIAYEGVKQGNATGRLVLTKNDISFQKADGNKETYSWGDVFKHQCSPPKIAKALLKLVLTNAEKPITFQLPNRKDLEKIRRDIAVRLQEYQDNQQAADEKLEAISEDKAASAEASKAKKSAPAADDSPTAKKEQDSDKEASSETATKGKQESTQASEEQPEQQEEKEDNSMKRSQSDVINDLLSLASMGSDDSGSEADSGPIRPPNSGISGLLAMSDSDPQETAAATGEIPSIFDDSFASLMADTGFNSDGSDDEFSVVTTDTRTAKAAKKATSLPVDYKDVTFRSMTGVATLTQDHLLFQPDETKHPGEQPTRLTWDSVERHHGSPPKLDKAVLKVFLKSGQSATFTMTTRRDLELIRMDLTSRLHERRNTTSFTSSALEGLVIGKGAHSGKNANGYVASYKKLPPGAQSSSAYHPVQHQQCEGSVFLSWDQLSFQPSGLGDVDKARTLFWDAVAGHEVSPDKPILTIKMQDGENVTFRFSNRRELEKCDTDAESRMHSYGEFESISHNPPEEDSEPEKPKSNKKKPKPKPKASEIDPEFNMQALLNVSSSSFDDGDGDGDDLFEIPPPPSLPPPPPRGISRQRSSSSSISSASSSSSSSNHSSSSSSAGSGGSQNNDMDDDTEQTEYDDVPAPPPPPVEPET